MRAGRSGGRPSRDFPIFIVACHLFPATAATKGEGKEEGQREGRREGGRSDRGGSGLKTDFEAAAAAAIATWTSSGPPWRRGADRGGSPDRMHTHAQQNFHAQS